ncbi:Serine/threonine protein kinase PrkC, regulator of stationary phase [hydrothermal vent metagenome]|uniref:Serine/threonine protein kinase PrkC, regulator of stationary phase n=1 Tax=hydrothermal vent metagenome TaxID=652676 RepID=A0A3B0ULF6_9ZZZZ
MADLNQDPLIGQQLDEYELISLLGRGGMARVYRGRDVRLKRDVAIKVIDAVYRADEAYRARFEREAQAIAQLEHPHIVRLYRYGEVSGLFYMAMQYVPGQDLRGYLNGLRAQDEWLPALEAARLVRELCGALDYAHSKGIIHRDVKPSNIMLGEDGRSYLTDFGLVWLAGSETKGEIFGSPHYLAPEQAISSAQVVPQSDLYGVGVILYQMFTGQRPFEGVEPLEIVMKQMGEAPPSPQMHRPELNAALTAVILKALAKEPNERFANGNILATAVEQAIQQPNEIDLPLPAAPSTPASFHPLTPSPPPPAVASAPLSAQPRTLPPAPAAVAMGQAQQTVTPTPKAEKVATNNGRSCLIFLLLLLLVLGVGGAAGWFFGWQQYSLDDFAYLAENGRLPPTTMPTATASPTATATLLPTVPPTVAATEMVVETATSTRLAPAVFTPTLLATSLPTPLPSSTPAPLPTATNTPAPTPFVIVTRDQDGMPQVLIPATTFLMGARDEDTAASPDERSQHEVSLDAFAIDLYEVSVAQYAAFLNTLGEYVNACSGFTCLSTRFETTRSYLTDEQTGYLPVEGFAEYPINNVSWHGANAYCSWVGGRLPTEAEWELAATGRNGRFYPWGDDNPDGETAVFASTFASLQPVNSLPDGASPFGLYHMAGNVWEWVADGYDPIYYDRSPAENPTGPAVSATDLRILRGGGYDSPAADLRTTNRASERPTEFRTIPSVGFRCVTPTD